MLGIIGVSVGMGLSGFGDRGSFGECALCIESACGPATARAFPDCGALGWGSCESDLEAGPIGVEEVVGQRKVSPRFEQ